MESNVSAIPAHVPSELVFDCSLADRQVYFENIFETMIEAEHVAKPPIYWCPNIYFDGSGGWIVRRVAELREVYADDELFTKAGFSGFAKMIGENWNMVPTELGGAEHQKVRRVLNPVYASAKMFSLEETVRDRARELIGRFKDRGSCDFVAEFAVPFPVSIFLDLFGLPQEDASRFLAWEHDLLHNPQMSARMTATREVRAFLLETIRQRREQPKADLISYALDYLYDDVPWTDDMVFGYCFNLFVGGLDTVSANIGLHMYHLATHPEQQAELRADPMKLAAAIEEMLRAYAAVTTFRTVTRDIEFHGVQMRQGDKVATATSLAGRDPEAWPAPGEVRFERKPGHLTFGGSSHRCLGMHLARRELLVAYQEMFASLPEFRLDRSSPVPFWMGSVIQVRQLPLVWDV